MKRCNKCLEEKPLSAFTPNKSKPDGRIYTCRICLNAIRRGYQKLDHVQRRRQNWRQTPTGKASNLKSRYKYMDKFPEKTRAHNVVRLALKTKKILKTPCVICGNKKTEGHHEDYSKPFDVIWLCRNHHREVHRVGVEGVSLHTR